MIIYCIICQLSRKYNQLLLLPPHQFLQTSHDYICIYSPLLLRSHTVINISVLATHPYTQQQQQQQPLHQQQQQYTNSSSSSSPSSPHQQQQQQQQEQYLTITSQNGTLFFTGNKPSKNTISSRNVNIMGNTTRPRLVCNAVPLSHRLWPYAIQ